MDEFRALRALAHAMGVHDHYTDGLDRHVQVSPETLVKVCAAAGAQISSAAEADDALRSHFAAAAQAPRPPVLVAWDGVFTTPAPNGDGPMHVELRLEHGDVVELERSGLELRSTRPLPLGYHRLVVDAGGRQYSSTVIAAPVMAWRRPGSHRSWGVAAQLPALRSSRSRSVGDLQDLRTTCEWVRARGGDLVTLLPLLPTFNSAPPEPSPYSPVSRLFWSETILDLGAAHRPSQRPQSIDVSRADAEVRAALAGAIVPDASLLDDELVRYARFRGAQSRLGRNWRDWEGNARTGRPDADQVDAAEERFHLVAQTMLRRQLLDVRAHLEEGAFRLGLDLPVGVHPDGYDPWSRQSLFGAGMSVGAPPDPGFPSGQDWGLAPVLPAASQREGHRYVAASVAHQAALAGVLRVDHIMAWSRLYWIPHGFELDQGTYVSYPAEELFAVLTLESTRHRCEILGENLGTVPPEIDEALPRHRIWGMYLAQFEASGVGGVSPPASDAVALVGTHDTPTFAGWLAVNDVDERVRYRLLAPDAAADVTNQRRRAVRRLADALHSNEASPQQLLTELLEWLGRSPSPLVVAWLEDLWLEEQRVNLPGTPSSVRPNWQRPMSRLLDDIISDPLLDSVLLRLRTARGGDANAASASPP
jgi:4-alpha-glucanotransferase